MTRTRRDLPASIGRETARTVAKLGLGALSLIWLAVLVSLLPGLDRVLPATTDTLVAHWGLDLVLVPVLGAAAWLSALGLFHLALPPVAIVAARVSAALDPAAEDLAAGFVGEDA
jgi:hypothetical protein